MALIFSRVGHCCSGSLIILNLQDYLYFISRTIEKNLQYVFAATFVPHRHLSFISSLSKLFVFCSGFLLFIKLYFCVFHTGDLTTISSSVSAPNPPRQGRVALRLGVKDVKAIRISIRVIISPDSGGRQPPLLPLDCGSSQTLRLLFSSFYLTVTVNTYRRWFYY